MDKELAEQIKKIAERLQHIGSDLYVRAFQNYNIRALTIGQFRYLEVIAKNPNITPSNLAEIFKVKKPTVTQIINELVSKDLIERIASENDRRVCYLKTTKVASNIINYRNKMYEKFAHRIQQILSKESLSQYKRLNKKIIGNY